MKKITRKQYEELVEARTIDKCEFRKLLEEYADIEAKAYTGYQYFDSSGNYVGDDCDSDVRDILYEACIDIEGEEDAED